VQVREGRSPSLKSLPPLLHKEREIKGVRIIKNFLFQVDSSSDVE